MNRRDFLKSVFGVTTGLAVIPSVVKVEPEVFIHGTTKDFIEVGQPTGHPRLRVFKDCEPMLKDVPKYTYEHLPRSKLEKNVRPMTDKEKYEYCMKHDCGDCALLSDEGCEIDNKGAEKLRVFEDCWTYKIDQIIISAFEIGYK